MNTELKKGDKVSCKKKFWKHLDLSYPGQHPGGIWDIFHVKNDTCTISRAELRAVGGNKRRYIRNVKVAWLNDATKEYQDYIKFIRRF
jgi:hypothetical protein